MFDGEDSVGWITGAETYYEVQDSSEEVKGKLAKLSMEGTTICLFHLLRETGRRFNMGDTGEGAEFECISSQVGRLPEDQYLG